MKGLSGISRRTAIGIGIFALFAVGVGIAGAQRPGGPPPTPDGPRAQAERELHQEFVSRLAQNLGLPDETVRAALEQTHQEMQPLVRERMERAREHLRERARGLRERFRGSDGPFPGRGGGRFGGPDGPFPGMRGGPPGPDIPAVVAEILNITPETLRQEVEAGKSLAQVAQERGVSPDALVDQIIARAEQHQRQMMREAIRRQLEQPLRPPR